MKSNTITLKRLDHQSPITLVTDPKKPGWEDFLSDYQNSPENASSENSRNSESKTTNATDT